MSAGAGGINNQAMMEVLVRATGVALLLLTASISPVLAQNVEAGHRLAAMWCSSCHQVEAAGNGPSRDIPPPFASVAALPSTTAISLNAFLVTPHPAMPNFSLSRQEIADVSAYILSLRPPARR